MVSFYCQFYCGIHEQLNHVTLDTIINVIYCHMKIKKALKKNFMVPFYGWGSTASRLEPLRRGNLLFTTKFPELPGTQFIDFKRMKGSVNLGATQWF